MKNRGLRSLISSISVILSLSLICSINENVLFVNSSAISYDNTTCGISEGNNIEKQNYGVWSNIVGSYLFKLSDNSLMRVQGANNGEFDVEYYDSGYNFKGYKHITAGLPIFGGVFVADDGYSYVLSGKNNEAKTPSAEVFRVTKYDRDWNYVSHTQIYGHESDYFLSVYEPFAAGSAYFTQIGRELIIGTNRSMGYAGDDHHQANITICLDMDDITYKLDNSGYVSHSFIHIVKSDNEKLISVDHGDAYPRGLLLGINLHNDVIYNLPGETGDNNTGISVGGFEISDSTYLVAINSIDMNRHDYSGTRNIMVISVPKNDTSIESSVVKQITAYAEGSESANTPRIVKVSNNEFLLLWSKNNVVYYTMLDASGNNGTIYNMQGNLSDCQPVVYNGKVIWYTYMGEDTTFYEIDASNISRNNKVVKHTGHDYKYQSINNGIANIKCDKCGGTRSLSVPTSVTIYSKKEKDEGMYWGVTKQDIDVSDKLCLLYGTSPENLDNDELVLTMSNPNILSYDYQNRVFTPLCAGKTKATFTAKYNPSVSFSIDITVSSSSKYSISIPNNVSVTRNGRTVNNGASLDYGDKLIITADPPSGKTLSSLTVNGNSINNGAEYTVVGDTVISVQFREKSSTGNISGNVKCNGGTDNAISIELLDSNRRLVSTADAAGGRYLFAQIPNGKYIIKASKTGFISREYNVNVEGDDLNIDVDIRKLGELTGDGVVDAKDATQILRYEAEIPCIIKDSSGKTDQYMQMIANVLSNDPLNAKDATQILRFEARMKSIFDTMI